MIKRLLKCWNMNYNNMRGSNAIFLLCKSWPLFWCTAFFHCFTYLFQNYATPEIKADKLSQAFQQLSNKLENMSTACAGGPECWCLWIGQRDWSFLPDDIETGRRTFPILFKSTFMDLYFLCIAEQFDFNMQYWCYSTFTLSNQQTQCNFNALTELNKPARKWFN